jgi:hypothetical protein
MKHNRGKLIIALYSGLGNQMFHYSFYKYLRLAGFNVYLDKNSPESRTQREKHEVFHLDYFPIKDIKFAEEQDAAEFFPKTEEVYHLPFITILRSKPLGTAVKAFWHKLGNKLGFSSAPGNCWVEWDKKGPGKAFYRHKLTKNTRAYLTGRFQEYRYPQSIREQLMEDFAFKREVPEPVGAYLARITAARSVSIHIRRRDYSGSEEYDVCTLQYYKNAVRYMVTMVQDAVFFIFSDDLDWVAGNFTFLDDYTIVDTSRYENSGYFDLYLMAQCRHNIIPNSTFSFWGAWLNRNPDKIVVCPEKWNGLDLVYTDEICPPEWIRVGLS